MEEACGLPGGGRSPVMSGPCSGGGLMNSFLLPGPALLWEPWLENSPPPRGAKHFPTPKTVLVAADLLAVKPYCGWGEAGER